MICASPQSLGLGAIFLFGQLLEHMPSPDAIMAAATHYVGAAMALATDMAAGASEKTDNLDSSPKEVLTPRGRNPFI